MQSGVWKGGGGDPDPAFLLLFFNENPTSHFLFLFISCISCPILVNPASRILNPESCTVLYLSEIPDPVNTLPDPGSLRTNQFCLQITTEYLHEAKQNNMCVSCYRLSLSLGHRPKSFYCHFWFFTIYSSHRKMFSV